MRGGDKRTGELFSYVDLEARVRRDHPLRAIRMIANEALSSLEREFAALYSLIGRPSIPPEKLLRAMLLQTFYSIHSERLLMERLEYDLLFRWLVGIGVDDAAWNHSVFSKNRDRLLEGDIAAKFLAAVLAQPRVKKLLSSDHFSVDGTLIEACLNEERQAEGQQRRKAVVGAMRKPTFMARNARTTPMLRPPIPMPGSIARVKARRRSCASSGMD
jgi:transposase